jgi:uncharacterized RDD family membrane protein YckC
MVEDPNETARKAFGDDRAGGTGEDASATPLAEAPRPGTGPARHGIGAPLPTTYGARRPVSQLADWWTRAGAFLLDQLVVAGAAFAAAFAVAALAGDTGDDTARILVYAVALPLGFFYAPLLMARAGARNGQTLGKQVVGIRVVRIDGAPVTFGTGVMRTFVGQQLLIAVTFYLYAVIDYLWPLRDPQNQALHDKIAKTLVLRTAAPPTSPLSEEPAAPGWLPPRAPH